MKKTSIEMTEKTPHGTDKVAHYKWEIVDNPGEMRWISKHELFVDDAYQRTAFDTKIKLMTARWSWIACGVLIVALRDGKYFVIDGQHRALASLRRSDITELPCIVFRTNTPSQEANGFLVANTHRKPVDAFGKHKAAIVAGDEVAVYVSDFANRLGLKFTPSLTGPGQIKSLAWCLKRAAEDRQRFERVLRLALDISNDDGVAVHKVLLEGLWSLDGKVDGGVAGARVRKKIVEKGATVLVSSANKAAGYYGQSNGKVWATGMLGELNKGLRNRIDLVRGEEDEAV